MCLLFFRKLLSIAVEGLSPSLHHGPVEYPEKRDTEMDVQLGQGCHFENIFKWFSFRRKKWTNVLGGIASQLGLNPERNKIIHRLSHCKLNAEDDRVVEEGSNKRSSITIIKR